MAPEDNHRAEDALMVRNGASGPSASNADDSPQESDMERERSSTQASPPAERANQELATNDDLSSLDRERRSDRAGATIDQRVNHNSGQMIGQLFEAVHRHSGAPLPEEWVTREVADYIPIGNEAYAVQLLKDTRVLVLIAEQPGSGRWTAALRLLSSTLDQKVNIRRIRRDSGDSFAMEGLRGQKNTGWILDLRDPDESIPEKCDLGHELAQTRDLHADGSYLVVLVGAALWQRIGHGASSLALTPDPPQPIKLFTALLRSWDVAAPEAWAEDHRFKQPLENIQRPGQVREWARAVALSYAQYETATGRKVNGPHDEGFDEIAKTAGNEVSAWMEVLATWHSDPQRTSYERNYLLLAAVLDGAPIDGVHRRITSLARALGEKGEAAQPLVGQQGPGLIQLARQIEAELLPDGRLRFPGPGFAEAVVQYFWRDRPELANEFTRWTAQFALELKGSQGTQLAERMAPWVVRRAQVTRSTRLLRMVATDWSENKNLAPYAQELLVTASLDPQIGHRVRNALGMWINDEDAEAPLLKTLARVCQHLAPAHPEQMLRRLGALAGSIREGVADAVGEAIDGLWSDDDLRPRLHRTLISWLTSDQETPRQSATSAFLNLARQRDDEGMPVLLRELGTAEGDWVVSGWRTVLEAEEPSDLARHACAVWLDVAAICEAVREQTITALVNAVHDTPSNHLRGRRHLNYGRLADYWSHHGEALDEEGRAVYRQELMRRAESADPYQLRSQEGLGSRGV